MEQHGVIEQLKSLTSHSHIQLTHRGDGAILLALHIVKCASIEHRKPTAAYPTILIPDQAGWLSYQTLPKLLGFNIVEVKTDNGLIDLADLKEKITSTTAAAILIQSLGGYFVQQPMEDIISICKKNNCLVIEDISGSIGFLPSYDSDIKVCSFGLDKLVNVGTGGCLSCKENYLTQFAEEFAPTVRLVQPLFDTALLLQKLTALKSRVAFLSAKAQNIKSDLVHHTIIHRQSVAINVVAVFSSAAEQSALIEYCQKNKIPFKQCPRYNRVLAPAISIEVKKLS